MHIHVLIVSPYLYLDNYYIVSILQVLVHLFIFQWQSLTTINRKDIISEKDEPLLRQNEVESGVINPWRWDWLEKTLEGWMFISTHWRCQAKHIVPGASVK